MRDRGELAALIRHGAYEEQADRRHPGKASIGFLPR